MKKRLFTLALTFIGLYTMSAQVGIGTETPKTSLQVVGEPTSTTTADGVQVPSLSLEQLDAKVAAYGTEQNGAIVYIDDISTATSTTETASIDAVGFYYYDSVNNKWNSIGITEQQASAIETNTAKDGSETKITAGTDVTVTGTGTTESPYVVNATISSPTYTIGLNADLGGYVFYVTPDGKHGLVAATQDQSSSSNWYSAQDFISNPTNHKADSKKFTDWRMPTKYELNLLYLKKSEVGGFADAYWSSSEFDTNFAWVQSFKDGVQIDIAKNSKINVRAVRAF